MAAKSFMLSALKKRFAGGTMDAFLKVHAHDWLVWEPGQWKPESRRGATTAIANAAPQTRQPLPAKGTEVLVIALEGEDLRLGRGKSCDIVINEGTLSTVHAALLRNKDRWEITDVGSTNGSWLDGIKLKSGLSLALTNGGQLQAGSAYFTFHTGAGLFQRLLRD